MTTSHEKIKQMIDLNKIKKFIPIILIISAFIDTNFDLLLSIGVPANYINWIKLTGLIVAAFTNPINFNKK